MDEVKIGPKVIDVKPITHENLMNEYDFLTLERFMKKMLAEGKVTIDEFNKIMQKIRDKFSPLYPELRV